MSIYEAFATGYKMRNEGVGSKMWDRNIGAEALAAMPSRAVIQREPDRRYERARELARLEKEQEFRQEQERAKRLQEEREKRWQRIREQEERQHQRLIEQEKRVETARQREKEATEAEEERKAEVKREHWNMAMAGAAHGFYTPVKDYYNRHGDPNYNIEDIEDVEVGEIDDPQQRQLFEQMGPGIKATRVQFSTGQTVFFAKGAKEVGNSNLRMFVRTTDPTRELGQQTRQQDIEEREAAASKQEAVAKEKEANLKIIKAKDEAAFKKQWGGFSEDTVKELLKEGLESYDPIDGVPLEEHLKKIVGAIGGDSNPIKGWRMNGNVVEFKGPDGKWQGYFEASEEMKKKLAGGEELPAQQGAAGEERPIPKTKKGPDRTKSTAGGGAMPSPVTREAEQVGSPYSAMNPAGMPQESTVSPPPGPPAAQTPGYYGGPAGMPEYEAPSASDRINRAETPEAAPSPGAPADTPAGAGAAMDIPQPKKVEVDQRNNEVVITDKEGNSWRLRLTPSGIVKLPA